MTMTDKIRIQQIFEAYKKFKNYCYYDNSSMFTRQVIADFEDDFFKSGNSTPFKELFESNKHINNILDILNNNDDKKLSRLLKNVNCWLIPKSPVEDNSDNDNGIKFISNVKRTEEPINVASVNALIDAPIEIHIISILWLMIVGVKYSSAIGSSSYANLFELNDIDSDEKRMSKGYHLFKPYFEGYQDWRDKAMKEAERLLDNDRNATIVSLDIKRFYYSVRINLDELLKSIKIKQTEEEPKIFSRLTDILQKVHEEYNKKVAKYIDEAEIKQPRKTSSKSNEKIKRAVLPVGLLSSGFIANLYMSQFDYQVSQRLKCSYYGRYVDDMLFVFPDMIVKDLNDFIEKTFIDSCILEKPQKNEEVNGVSYKLKDHNNQHYNNLKIQEKKIVIEHFDHRETRAALKKFIKNLKKNRSEFRFIPDEEGVESDFDDSAFNLQYTDSVNKFRSIKDFAEDKYGASSYLAHKIFLSCYTTSTKSKNENGSKRQIVQFFSGKTAIFFYTLWDKVITYFIINKDSKNLRLFIEHIFDSLDNLNCINKEQSVITESTDKLRTDLKLYLSFSIATSLAIDTELKIDSKKAEVISIINIAKEYAEKFRHSNLFTHSRLRLSALPATNAIMDNKVNLMYPRLSDCDLDMNDERIKFFFPRFLHYDEISIIEFYKVLEQRGNEPDPYNLGLIKSYKTINEHYNEINYCWYNLFSDNKDRSPKNTVKFTTVLHENDNDLRSYITIRDDYNAAKLNRSELRIAIANMKVDQYVISKTAIGKPDLTLERRNELFSIINSAIRNDVDMLVLPELSVPFQWLSLLTQQCKKNHIAIVTGLTYFCNADKMAFNTVATLLPFSVNGYTSCFVNLRLKNHYSPSEISTIEGFRYKVPPVKTIYNHFHWHNLYFTVYNCFELASIEDRSLFKSQVDLLIATELNRDTNYFSEIAGSWVRDIHAFFVQVNTSEYGESRIMKPSSKDTRILVNVTGGENPTLLVKDLDIKGLRNYEFKEYNLQAKDSSYKMTPPDYEHEKALSRMNDEDMFTKDSKDK